METGSALHPGVAYMMLAHLNMLKGYMWKVHDYRNSKPYFKRIFKLKAQITEEMSRAKAALAC